MNKNINLYILIMLVVVLEMIGCTRYHSELRIIRIEKDIIYFNYELGAHEEIKYAKEQNVEKETAWKILLEKELEKINICQQGYIISGESRSRHYDFSIYGNCSLEGT